jgi:hypothetical protein
MIKKTPIWKKNKPMQGAPPLVYLDIQDDKEDDIEVDRFLEGKNIPLKRIACTKIEKTINPHEEFPTS